MNTTRVTSAALTTLITLQAVMLAALFAKVPPHPPVTTPLFGIAPFVGMSIAVACSAMLMGAGTSGAGKILGILAALCAAVSFGPQKYFDPQFAMIWPAVISGQVAILALLVAIFRRREEHSVQTASDVLEKA